MSGTVINVRVFRFEPSVDREPRYRTYEVPLDNGMSAMNVLDYIYHNLDGTIAYYDHAGCSLGICGQCAGRVNGRPGLFCQTLVHGDITLEPIAESRVVRDLVVDKRR